MLIVDMNVETVLQSLIRNRQVHAQQRSAAGVVLGGDENDERLRSVSQTAQRLATLPPVSHYTKRRTQ